MLQVSEDCADVQGGETVNITQKAYREIVKAVDNSVDDIIQREIMPDYPQRPPDMWTDEEKRAFDLATTVGFAIQERLKAMMEKPR